MGDTDREFREWMRSEVRELRNDVKVIRSRTDRLEARAGMVGAVVAFVVSLAWQVWAFLRGGH